MVALASGFDQMVSEQARFVRSKLPMCRVVEKRGHWHELVVGATKSATMP
jgi:hypothetical protein